MSNATVKAQSPAETFRWLIKREFWEYRGAIFLAPTITLLIMLGIFLCALIAAEVFASHHGFTLNGIHVGEITNNLSDDQVEKARAGMDVGLLGMGFPIAVVLFFVLFSYCTGALYNDRADRSVLFWKSLPLSDTQTVLAKVATATLVAPLFAIGAMMVLHVGFLLLMSFYFLAHGVNAFGVLWSPTHLIGLWLKLIVALPVNALWALPSIGWLMLVSSFVRSKPFLWSLMLPFAAGVIVSTARVVYSVGFVSWFWQHIVLRVIFSIAPGSWLKFETLKEIEHSGSNPPEVLASMFSFGTIFDQLTSPDLLLGAAAGAAMIGGAIWLRRTRVEAYA